MFVIAPLGANTMAKMACGMCNNLLVSFLSVLECKIIYSATA